MNNKFRTEIKLSPVKQQISYQSAVFFIGSCFSNNIGDKLQNAKLSTFVNPLGVVFNPVSIAEQLKTIAHRKLLNEADVFEYNGTYKSFSIHSSFNAENRESLLKPVNQRIEEAHEFLKVATHIFITLGSAFAYTHLKNDRIVANCHKLPQSSFQKQLLSYEEVMSSLSKMSLSVSELNPNAEIIFTVSPVKHIKDGIVEDNVSKSILIAAVSAFVKTNKLTSYFPAYELVNNDLRDYRYYSEDMAHPSPRAIEYIFEKFANAYFNDETLQTIKEVSELHTALQHRIVTNNRDTNMFAESMLRKINILKKKSQLDFSEEEKYFTGLTS